MWVDEFGIKDWLNFMQTTVQVSNTIGKIYGYFFYYYIGSSQWKYGFLTEVFSVCLLTLLLAIIPDIYYDKCDYKLITPGEYSSGIKAYEGRTYKFYLIFLLLISNNNFINMLGVLNPFIAKIGNVGVSKRLNDISYNNGIAILLNEYIEECILNQRKKAYDAIDFQNFVNEMYESAKFAKENCSYYKECRKEMKDF